MSQINRRSRRGLDRSELILTSRIRRSNLLREQMDITFFGQMDVTNSVLPYMRQRKAGLIVMVGSRSAWRPELPVDICIL